MSNESNSLSIRSVKNFHKHSATITALITKSALSPFQIHQKRVQAFKRINHTVTESQIQHQLCNLTHRKSWTE